MIKYKDINLSFDSKRVFNDFNLKISEGDKILLNAPSGSGKTTLLKMLMGYVVPDGGNITYKDENISHENIDSVRKDSVYISQEADFGSGEVIEIIKNIFSFKNNRHIILDNSKLSEYLEMFSLGNDYIYKEFKDLSGGEKQRVIIITSLLLDKKIMLLDEVTSALDDKLKDKVISYLMNTNKTIISISHDLNWVNAENIKLINW